MKNSIQSLIAVSALMLVGVSAEARELRQIKIDKCVSYGQMAYIVAELYHLTDDNNHFIQVINSSEDPELVMPMAVEAMRINRFTDPQFIKKAARLNETTFFNQCAREEGLR
jgi:hypothetical protein